MEKKLQKEIEELKKKLAREKERGGDDKDKLKKLQEELEKFKNLYYGEKDKNGKLQLVIVEKDNEIEKLKLLLQQLQKDLDNCNETKKFLQDELDKLREQLKNYDAKFKEREKELLDKIAELYKIIDEL